MFHVKHTEERFHHMFDPSVIFQRTHEGRTEIKQKSHGLTQSERLVLIMVDGVSSYQVVRDKLPALTDDRFNRALHKLHQKELILEVFMPTQEDEAEHLEQDVIERFLHQDALDPVTIIMFDPEDELAGISAPASSPYKKAMEKPASTPQPAPHSAPQPILQSAPQPLSQPVSQPSPLPDPVPTSGSPAPVAEPLLTPPISSAQQEPVVALDDEHKEMVDSLARELKQRLLDRPAKTPERQETPPQFHFPDPKPHVHKMPMLQMHWGYWMMGIGTAFIVGYFLL
jgi:hypothetical protein